MCVFVCTMCVCVHVLACVCSVCDHRVCLLVCVQCVTTMCACLRVFSV